MRLRPAEVSLRLVPLAAAALWCGLAPRLPGTVTLCGFRWLTGRPCPLCGLTHSLAALAQCRWSEAVSLHPLSPLVAALLLSIPLLPLRPAMERRVWQAAAAAFGLFGVLRFC